MDEIAFQAECRRFESGLPLLKKPAKSGFSHASDPPHDPDSCAAIALRPAPEGRPRRAPEGLHPVLDELVRHMAQRRDLPLRLRLEDEPARDQQEGGNVPRLALLPGVDRAIDGACRPDMVRQTMPDLIRVYHSPRRGVGSITDDDFCTVVRQRRSSLLWRQDHTPDAHQTDVVIAHREDVFERPQIHQRIAGGCRSSDRINASRLRVTIRARSPLRMLYYRRFSFGPWNSSSSIALSTSII
jgi:hypothetical protein